MANIKPYTDKIASAIYGEQVRGSIISALEASAAQSSAAETAATNAETLNSDAHDLAQEAKDLADEIKALKDIEVQGFSPTVTTSKSGKTTTITITDRDGTRTSQVLDGEDGASISSITMRYCRSSASTPPSADSSYSTTLPTLSTTYKYLHGFAVYAMTDGSTVYGPKHLLAVFGNTGQRGSTWEVGTAITGTDTVTVGTMPNGDFYVNDMYFNPDTFNLYRCTKYGFAQLAEWKFVCNLNNVSDLADEVDSLVTRVQLLEQTLTSIVGGSTAVLVKQ